MPVVKAAKGIQAIGDGAILEILATDKGSCKDIPAWCRTRNLTLLYTDEADGYFRFYVRKG